MSLKPEIRILGVDDAPFTFDDDTTEVIGCLLRGSRTLEAVLSTTVTVDGTDATGSIAEMLLDSRQHDQTRAIMLDGITYGGLNVLDIQDLAERTDRPVIAVTRQVPDHDALEDAIANTDDDGERLKAIERAGTVHQHDDGRLSFQCAGIEPGQAREYLDVAMAQGNLPEPVRVAHLIAAGIKTGESKGDA